VEELQAVEKAVEAMEASVRAQLAEAKRLKDMETALIKELQGGA